MLHEVCCKQRVHKPSSVPCCHATAVSILLPRDLRVNSVPEMAVVNTPGTDFPACDTLTLDAKAMLYSFVLTCNPGLCS